MAMIRYERTLESCVIHQNTSRQKFLPTDEIGPGPEVPPSLRGFRGWKLGDYFTVDYIAKDLTN